MSLSNKKRSQLTEEIKVLQTSEVKLKQFKAPLFLADEIRQKIGEFSPLRFTGIEKCFPEVFTAKLYPNLISRISPATKHLSALNMLLLFLRLTQFIIRTTVKI